VAWCVVVGLTALAGTLAVGLEAGKDTVMLGMLATLTYACLRP
jgi:hypothetical protein